MTFRKATAVVTCLVLVAPAVLSLVPGAAAQTTSSTGVRWGINVPAVDPLIHAGAKPDFAVVWVGPWTDGDWSGLDRTLLSLKERGVTPVIQWYYWGDDISQACVENGCASGSGHYKTKAHWYEMVHKLAERLGATMEGREVIVVVETEFNKRDIPKVEYAPTFDQYMLDHHNLLHQVPGVKTVAGFGTWWSDAWGRFPKTVAAADYVALQALRSSVRSTLDQYLYAPDYLSKMASVMNDKFPGKPIFITDMGFSSYPEPEYAEYQNAVVSRFFEVLPELAGKGVQGVMYRHLFDVSMDPSNYHGAAESWWGLSHQDGTPKPAYFAWLAGVGATPPAGAPIPATFEAEAMDATTGGRQSDSRASGGAAWNLWANGELRERVDPQATGTYEITVRARGSPMQEVWPQMVVSLDWTEVGRFNVASKDYADYTLRTDLPQHDVRELRVAFTNDARSSTEDRNLIVDKVTVGLLSINSPPVAAFTTTVSGRTVSVDASASLDPDGSALTYAWDFGDGNTAAGRTATHTYGADGTYTLKLIVSDGSLSASSSQDVKVASAAPVNAPPSASFAWNAQQLTIHLDASASKDPEGAALTYFWDLGDGKSGTGSAVGKYTYSTGGTYTVTLTVSDGVNTAATTQQVFVNRAPVASFTTATSARSLTVDASASLDADGDALTYAWDFGDGNTAAGRAATHTYGADGTFRVTLRVSDGAATTASITNVTVKAAPATLRLLEVEDFPVKTTGGWSGHKAASGGASWNLWSNGEASTEIVVPEAGAYVLGARVRGNYAVGAWSMMEVRVNGETVQTFVADSTTWRTYLTPVNLPGGVPVKVAIAFVNDQRNATEDRNLWADALTVDPMPPTVVKEAEAFATKSTGGLSTDLRASGGLAWNIWSNGHIEDRVTAGVEGIHVLEIAARTSLLQGVGARMVVSVNGQEAGVFHLTDTDFQTYRLPVHLSPGDHTVRVAFTNDARSSTEDRNLIVDLVRLKIAG